MHLRRSILSVCVASALAAAAGTAVAQQAKEVKLGYALAVNSHYGAAAQAWSESVEATNNAFKFKQFPSSALGGERELIEGLQLGTVEAVIVSTGALSNFVPDVGVVDIPFLFRDTPTPAPCSTAASARTCWASSRRAA
jgi:TRAP-type C4-dicarboxylate transport system substrate-binding protein